MNIKKGFLTFASVLTVVLLINGKSIVANAERYVDSGEYVSFDQLKKGDEFVDDEEDQFTFRVIKTAKQSKNKHIEVEITGFNPNPEHEYTAHDYEHARVFGNLMQDWGPYEIVGIADNAFKDNKDIRSFCAFGPHIRYIGKSAFEGCSNLREIITNRRGVKQIKARAFYNCSSLKTVNLELDILKTVGKDAFRNTRPSMKVYVEGVNNKQISKVKKLFKKAGAKKIRIKK